MSAGDRMQGKRIDSPFDASGGLIAEWPKPGDFYFYPQHGWCGVTPNGHQCGLVNHNVVEHEDGTITVAPSILVSGRDGDTITVSDDRGQLWHGYLERGIWREV